VDWYLPEATPDVVGEIRREVRALLERHAATGSDLDGVELIASELLSNAVRHAEGPMWVSCTWSGEHPELTVADLGPGFRIEDVSEPAADRVGGHGLHLVHALAPAVRTRARERGAVVAALLPVRRPDAVAVAPPRRNRHRLPSPEDAGPDGFGKEPFLVALTVQLARAVESEHGLAAAESAVTQVGTDVGEQMREEYRRAVGAVGRLDAEQLAACFVRLKAAIGGGFRVVAVDEDRIVLENDRCPFGDAVRQAPSLCRMTSSVFGGIAASERGDHATVDLEERIAVGDPGCRVVVYLRPDHPEATPAAHRYPAVVDGRDRVGEVG
jgi:anti-sigma regulatory factor (Ser/Thr protein kinase)